MKNNKNYRKNKSVKKAVRKALKLNNALWSVRLAVLTSCFRSQVAIIQAAKMKKGGCTSNECVSHAGNEIVHSLEKVDFKLIDKSTINKLKEKLNDIRKT